MLPERTDGKDVAAHRSNLSAVSFAPGSGSDSAGEELEPAGDAAGAARTVLAPIELDDLLWQRIGVFIRRTPYERIGKPVLDRVVALLLLILLSPVLAAALLWVRPQIGPGGAFFRQQRIGLGGRPFTIYKVRTMQVDRRLGAGGYGGPDRRSE
ncbi:MAG: sugar transferase, partial [Acidimicrobiia bacterium]